MRDRVGAAVVASVLITQCLGAAAPRGPSTPEERTKALQIIHHLETDPLADTKDERQWLTLWLVEVPDIHVPLCTEFFPSLLRDSDSKKRHGGDLVMQSGYAIAAFQIEHPTEAKDESALYLAGVEGALRTYEAILLKEPKSRWVELDALIAKREKGELAIFVRETVPKCKKK